MSHREIPNIEKLSSESRKLFNILNDEVDLHVILIGTSFLDISLASILKKYFIQDQISKKLLRGALGRFTSRAEACFALGLIEESLYNDLIIIAKIRNRIAHYRMTLTFETKDIQNLCNQLNYVKSLEYVTSFDLESAGQSSRLADLMVGARNQFILSVVIISQRLLLIGLGIKGDR